MNNGAGMDFSGASIEESLRRLEEDRVRQEEEGARQRDDARRRSSSQSSSPASGGIGDMNQWTSVFKSMGGAAGGNAAGGMTATTGSGTTLASGGSGIGMTAGGSGLGMSGAGFASGIGSGVGAGGGAAGGGAAGAASGGIGSMAASAGPWAALAAAIYGNEKSAKDGGYRREGTDYAKDLATGKVLYQDVDQRWAPKLFGENDKMGFGGDMRAASALGSFQPKKALDHFKDDSSIGKLLKKIF